MAKNNSSGTALVSIDGVYHRYAGISTSALNNIQMSIPRGCCFGLLGPNGAGKTTLISLLTGALSLQQGRICVDDLSLPNDIEKLKRMSALVPQDYAFYPALSARENLIFFAGLYQIPASVLKQRLQYSIEVCCLEAVLDQRAAHYSGGIKRRLNMAIGLLSQPKIIYLDEPTVGIDAQSRHFILEAIEHLKDSGMTIVYTSHYMEEVEQICDEIAIIDHGQVLLQERMDSLLQGDSRLQITPTNIPSSKIIAALPYAKWNGHSFMVDPSKQALSQCLLALEQQGLVVEQLHMGRKRLEDIYLSATHRKLRE